MDSNLQSMPQLIFLPGASGSTTFWHPLIEKLPQHYQTKIIGYPGFGDTPESLEVKSFNDLTNYVVDQINEESVIVAQSMGGIFAIAAALQKTHLVQGLVLIATSGGIDLTKFEVADWREAYSKEFLNYPEWFITTKVNYEQRLAEIAQKVLLIWGDQDPISPVSVGEYLHAKLPNAYLEVIADGQHDLANQHAKQVAVCVLDYLKSIESRLER